MDKALGDPLKRGDGTVVHFFTVVPLYTDERDYELKHRMKAFLEKFIEHKVPMTIDVNRKSFCSDIRSNTTRGSVAQ